MKTLLIIHANSWSDRAKSAKSGIEQLIDGGDFDAIIEVASLHPEAFEGRYLAHGGTVLQHSGISPVPFFEAELFGQNALFPISDRVTLAGGVLNSTGGGCLNCAFKYLVEYQRDLDRPCAVHVPIGATYQAGSNPWDEAAVEQVAKDLAWKMLVGGVPFVLRVEPGTIVASSGKEPMLTVSVVTP